MITRDLILNVGYTSATLNQPLVLYMYDRDIILNVQVKGYDFRFGATQDDILGQPNIVKAKTYLKSPSGEIFTDPMIETEITNNTVKILINNLMTDESSEIGEYQVQIQLVDEDGSKIHLHPFNFTVKGLIALTGDTDFDSSDNSDIHYDADYIETNNVITSDYLNGLEEDISYLYSEDFLLEKEMEEYKTNDVTTIGAINELLNNYHELNAYYNYLVEHMGSHVSQDEYRALALNYDSDGVLSLSTDYSTYVSNISIINKTYGKHIPVGEYYLFRWTAIPNKYKFNIRWKSDNPSIARVNSIGKVTGVSPGTTRIKVYFKYNENVFDYVDVTVGDYTPITSLTVSPVSLKLDINAMGTVSYNIKPADTTQDSISYTTEGDPCVFVAQDYENKRFVLTGRSNGTCNIVVYSTANPSKKAICKVTVGDGQYIDNKSITILDPGKYELEVGETLNLQCQVEPSGLGVSWKSSNPGVLTVDPNGKITAIGAGFSEITASINGYDQVSDTITLAVRDSSGNSSDPTNPNNYYVIIDSTKLNVKVGDSFIAGATTNPKDANISWEIEDSKLVSYRNSTYTENDLYNEKILECRALNIGTTRVYCKFTGPDGNEYKDCQFINVVSDKKTLSIQDAPAFVPLNESAKLKCVTYPANLASNVRWKVSNGEIASINQQGLFTATGEGFVRVTCYVNDEPEIKDEVLICVGDEKLMGGRVYIDREDIPNPPKVGNYFTVKAGTFPANADITWSVDNTSLVDLSIGTQDLPAEVFEHPLLANLILKGEGVANLTCSFTHEGTGILISDTAEINIQSNPNPAYIISGNNLVRCYQTGELTVKSTDVHESLYSFECVSTDNNIIEVKSISNNKVTYEAKNVGVVDLIFTFTFGEVVTEVRKNIEVCPLIPESVFIVDPGEIDGNLESFQMEHGYNPVDEPNLNRNTYSQVWSIEPADVVEGNPDIDNTGLLKPNDGNGLFKISLKATIFDKIDNKFYEFYAELEVEIIQDVVIIIRRNTLDYIPVIFTFNFECFEDRRNEGTVDLEDPYIVRYKIDRDDKHLSFYSYDEISYPEVISEIIRFNVNSFKEMTSYHNMFYGCRNLIGIDFLSDWDVGNVTDMSYMFSYCKSLNSVSCLRNWDISNVTNMRAMFNDCSSLISLELSNWDVSSVTDMSGMFSDCSSLTSLESISNWDVSSVTRMSGMFSDCSSLTSLESISNWDVSSVTLMNNMFSDCSSLTSLESINNWDVSSVTSMAAMFNYCKKLTSVESIASWNVSEVVTMESMFDHTGIETIKFLESWSFNNHNSMYKMFAGCKSLSVVCTYYWNFGNFTGTCMFHNCKIKKVLIGSESFNIHNFPSMFTYCDIDEISIGNLNSYQTDYSDVWTDFLLNSSVNRLSIYEHNYKDCMDMLKYIIYYANHPNINYTNLNIKTLDLSNNDDKFPVGLFAKSKNLDIYGWQSSRPITDLSYMFYKCEDSGNGLKEISRLNIDMSNVTTMEGMFSKCYDLKTIKGISNWDTSNVTTMKSMFEYCYGLTSLEGIEYLDTSNIKNMSYMFKDCTSLTSLNLSNWDTSNVTDTSCMFASHDGIALDLSNWDVSKLYKTSEMFSTTYSDIPYLNLSNWKLSRMTLIDLVIRASNINLSNWVFSGTNSSLIEQGISIQFRPPYDSDSFSLNLSGWDLSSFNINKPIIYNTYGMNDLNLTGCNFKTVNMLLNNCIDFWDSKEFDQYIYVNRTSVEGLTPPEGWTFIYVD